MVLTVAPLEGHTLGTMRSNGSSVRCQGRWQDASRRSFAFFYLYGFGHSMPSGEGAVG